jgi:ribosomal protein S12 methylthiotransferase accessory factor
MEMLIDFPGGARVEAHFGPFTITTDQPAQHGGQGSAPTPFATFLASLGTCAGFYMLEFCRHRNLPTEDLHVLEKIETEPNTGRVQYIRLEIQLPPGFPEKYKAAVIRAAEQCAVKKLIEQPPTIEVVISQTEDEFSSRSAPHQN